MKKWLKVVDIKWGDPILSEQDRVQDVYLVPVDKAFDAREMKQSLVFSSSVSLANFIKNQLETDYKLRVLEFKLRNINSVIPDSLSEMGFQWRYFN